MRIAYQNALQLSLIELAEVHTAAYATSWASSPHMLAEIFRVQSVDLERSLVAYDGRKPIGLSLIGRRRAHGWLYDFAIVPAYRAHGLGSRLLSTTIREAAKAGIRDIELDVWEKRDDAIRLYRRVGFEYHRTYLNFEADGAQIGLADLDLPPGWRIEPCRVEDISAWYAAASAEPEPCWDRRLPSLLSYGDALACVLHDEQGPAAALHYAARHATGRDPNRIRPMFVGLRSGAGAAYLRALLAWAGQRSFGDPRAVVFRVALEPDGSTLAALLDSIGLAMVGRAHDMRITVDPD